MNHGAIPRDLWQQPAFKELKPNTKLTMTYVLSSPLGNSAHLFRCGPHEIALACGFSPTVARTGLEQLGIAGFLHVDFSLELLWVESQMLAELGPALKPGDNRIKFLTRLVGELPECSIRADFVARYSIPYHLKIEAPSKPPSRALPTPFEAKNKDKNKHNLYAIGGSVADPNLGTTPAREGEAAASEGVA